MPIPYRLPTPLPQLPVRKGIRGRRPKSETIALLKALAASTEAQDIEDQEEATPQTTPFSQHPLRPYKKRGPKPGSKVALKDICVDLWRTVILDTVVEGVIWWNTSADCVFVSQRKPRLLQSAMSIATSSDSRVPMTQMPSDGLPPLGSPSSVVSTGNTVSLFTNITASVPQKRGKSDFLNTIWLHNQTF